MAVSSGGALARIVNTSTGAPSHSPDGHDSRAGVWRTDGKPVLNALLDYVPWVDTSAGSATPAAGSSLGAVVGAGSGSASAGASPVPWRTGHALHLKGQGGVVQKERRHYTLVADGQYTNHIGGCRTLRADTQSFHTAGAMVVNVGRTTVAPARPVPWGSDALTVHGNADVEFHDRRIMMAGLISRNYLGGVMRLASMEGVICGGFFMRSIFGPAMTASALMTGDVYGGVARVAMVRTYLALLHYRAAAAAAWASLTYMRCASFVIEPMLSVPSDRTPTGNAASKLARLSRTFSAVRAICPPIDILCGVVMLPLLPIMLGKFLFMLLAKRAASHLRPKAKPPSGPPRTRIRNTAVRLSSWGTKTVI